MELKKASLSRSSTGSETSNFPPSLLMDVFSLSNSNPLPDEPATVGEDIYLYKFTERNLPDTASMTEEEKEQYTAQILSAKQERLIVAWIRHQEGTAEIYNNKNLQ